MSLGDSARKKALALILEGIRAADPRSAVRRCLRYSSGVLKILGEEVKVRGRIFVIGAGKATGGMATAVEEILQGAVERGVISVPEELAAELSLKRIEVVGATHPKPSQKSVEAGRKIVEIAREASEDDLVIGLISGGGSALMEYPAKGLTIDDISLTSTQLMKAGADIFELNTVRKHLSLLKGGWLAKHAYPARLVALMISDVVGDRLDTIASGPTVPDPTTFSDAKRVIERYSLIDKLPRPVIDYIEMGVRGEAPETPKPGDKIFEKVTNRVVASNIISLTSMSKKAGELGYRAVILTSMLEGEAREVGKVLASIAKEVTKTGNPVSPPVVILAGGETTVTVRGRGRGGRNQELALSAAIQIRGIDGVAIASVGSDGIDGPTDAAGAVVDGETVPKAERLGLDPFRFLDDNNSYEFFKAVGGHVKTGYTGTNVNDLIAIVIEKEAK